MRMLAGACKCRPLGKYRHCIMAAQAFPLAGDDTKISDPVGAAKGFYMRARGIFDEYGLAALSSANACSVSSQSAFTARSSGRMVIARSPVSGGAGPWICGSTALSNGVPDIREIKCPQVPASDHPTDRPDPPTRTTPGSTPARYPFALSGHLTGVDASLSPDGSQVTWHQRSYWKY